MKVIFKIAFFCCLFFYSFSLSAQITLEEYFENERIRIEKVKAIELEIKSFISLNLTEYKLNKFNNDEIKTHFGKELLNVAIDDIILQSFRDELRKLYFKEFPENRDYFYSTILPSQYKLECVNGGFEDETDPVINFNFFSSKRFIPGWGFPPVDESLYILGCETLSDVVPISSTVNDFNANVTVISSVDPGYVQFDPTLNTLARGFIQIPTISPNGENHSIKLNNSPGVIPGGLFDVTTMTRDIVIGSNDSTIDYEFSLLLQDSGTDHALNQKPSFRVDLIVGGNVVNTRCINAEPNCIFQLSHANGLPNSQDIYYSGWRCDQIDVTNFRGENATLVFTITDCYHGGHFGTVYIDNICNYECPNPVFGALITNPLDINCPDLINNTPYEVCGSFTPPLGATLNNIEIQISQNGGAFVQIPNAQLSIVGTNFCFLIDPSVFGINPSGNTYQFQIVADYTQNCDSITVSSSNTTFASITFNNCCEPTLVLTSADYMTNLFPLAVIQRERSNWISASNVIGIGDNAPQSGVVYHAGNFVELTPGFDAINDSQFVAYVEGCSANYEYRYQNHDAHQTIGFDKDKINLVKASLKDFSIIPNPSSNSIEILTSNIQFNKVEIISIDGRKVFETSIENSDKIHVDISSYNNGIYIVTVTDVSGQQFSQKLIKN